MKKYNLYSKSNLPDADYVINPYIGCTHGCMYCYACFMGRFSGHKEPWGSYLEVKAENLIRRDKGTAESPRFMERVPAGLEFNLEILVQVFDGDQEDRLKEEVEKALRMVELSYLGGSGSRGYGQVKFQGEWKEIEVR